MIPQPQTGYRPLAAPVRAGTPQPAPVQENPFRPRPGIASAGQPLPRPEQPLTPRPQGTFKKGGAVKKTGTYKLHAGERVLNKKQAKLVPVAMLLRAKKP